MQELSSKFLEEMERHNPRTDRSEAMMSDLVIDFAKIYLGGNFYRSSAMLHCVIDTERQQLLNAVSLFDPIDLSHPSAFSNLTVLGLSSDLQSAIGFSKIMIETNEEGNIVSTGRNNFIYTSYRNLRIASGLEAVSHVLLQEWSDQNNLPIYLTAFDDCDPSERQKWDSLFDSNSHSGYKDTVKIINPGQYLLSLYNRFQIQYHPNQDLITPAITNYIQTIT